MKKAVDRKRRTEYMTITDLTSAKRNPKMHAEAEIAASFRRFGYVEQIALDERTGRIVAGHGRRDQLLEKMNAGEPPPEGIEVDEDTGEWLVPVQRGWASKNDTEANAYLIASNRHPELGGWDDGALAEMLLDIQKRGDLAGIGYDDDALTRLLEEVRGPVPDPQNLDEIPMIPAKPITKLGDVWLLGRHRLMCGDSTNAEHVRVALNGRAADLVFTSPPYNVGVAYDGHDDETVPWEKYEAFLRAALAPAIDHLENGRMLCWNIGTTPKTHHPRQHLLIESMGMTYVRQLVWRKVGVMMPLWHNTVKASRARAFTPNYQHEVVLLFSKGPVHRGESIEFDNTLEHDVFTMNQTASTRDLASGAGTGRTGAHSNLGRRSTKVHPAPFTVSRPRAFIVHLADVGAVVFDPFAGVASTLLAAELTERVGVGLELSPAYVDAACERWQRVMGQRPVLEASGRARDFTGAVPRQVPV